MERVGVRELRQHASRYLARVGDGETIEITDRGRPVALLVPVASDVWQDLLAAGRISRPTVDGSVVDETPGDYGVNASNYLQAMREHER